MNEIIVEASGESGKQQTYMETQQAANVDS